MTKSYPDFAGLISVNLKKKLNKAMRWYKTIDPKLHSKVKILYYDSFFIYNIRDLIIKQ